jgi:hypothetical protein
MALLEKLKARRKKRKAEDKWVLGEKLTKAGRERASVRKKKKRYGKGGIKVERGILARSGDVRKDVKGVEITGKTIDKAQAFPKYEKKSKAAGSFRAAFKKGCAGGESGSFSWDGRSYSCKRAAPSKKQKAERKASMLPGGSDIKKATSYS